MKKRGLNKFLFFIFLSFLITNSVWSGQVVTPEVREWAKNALDQEKTLEAVKGRNKIAVLYFHNKTGDAELDPLRKGLTFMLITDLSTIEGLEVVERVRLQALTEEMGLGVSGLVESDTSPRIGKLIGAEWLAGGDILAKGDIPIHIDSSVLDVAGPSVLGQPTAEGILENFLQIEKDLLFKIIELLKIELTSEERESLKKHLSRDMKALLDLFKGLHASDESNYKEAEAYYERALKRDPNLSFATEFISELQVLGLVSPGRKENNHLLKSLSQETSLPEEPLEPERREGSRISP